MGGGWLSPHPGRFTPGQETRYPLYRRLCGLHSRSGRVRKISPTPVFDPRTFQPVASLYTDWAIPAHRHGFSLLINSILTSQFILADGRSDVVTSDPRAVIHPALRITSCTVDMALPWKRNLHSETSGFKSNCNKCSGPLRIINSTLCLYVLISP
jgi:hypothetical protein